MNKLHPLTALSRNPSPLIRLRSSLYCHPYFYCSWYHHDKTRRRPVEQQQCAPLSISSVLVPPGLFLGLGITLWIQKCLVMVLFQNKIIYMPNIPPLARWETVEEYAPECRPVEWREESTRAEDGVKISLLIGETRREEGKENVVEGEKGGHLVVLYFQGNASSLPPRLPFLSSTIKKINWSSYGEHRVSLVAVSYRGYWHSRGSPSQNGIERDARAAMRWVLQQYAQVPNLQIVFWGQSVGAGVATGLAAEYLRSSPDIETTSSQQPPLTGLVLETPFTNMRDLLLAFYPQKWLPYRYLSPFLRNHWDSEQALQRVSHESGPRKPKILIVQASQDEIVPEDQSKKLEMLCISRGLEVERQVIPRALHNDVMIKADGQRAIAKFLSQQL